MSKPVGQREYWDQTKWWQCKDGTWIKVKKMETSHLLNVLGWAYRNSRDIAVARCVDTLFSPGWSIMPDEVVNELETERVSVLADPEKWISETKLYGAVAHEAMVRLKLIAEPKTEDLFRVSKIEVWKP